MKLVVLLLSILHWFVVAYALTGWMSLRESWLLFYLLFVPIMVLHWKLNNNSCIINNLESWLLTGQWRSDSNPEEGAFVRTSLVRLIGWAPQPKAFDQLIYGVLAILWFVALQRLRVM